MTGTANLTVDRRFHDNFTAPFHKRGRAYSGFQMRATRWCACALAGNAWGDCRWLEGNCCQGGCLRGRRRTHLKTVIMLMSIGADPRSALQTRRSTGYYKVPSLKGVWYRGPFEHNGSVATLEDWFDPNRLKDDYVPTGFKGYGVKTRAVKGHEFGLELSPENKRALIAFLKTL